MWEEIKNENDNLYELKEFSVKQSIADGDVWIECEPEQQRWGCDFCEESLPAKYRTTGDSVLCGGGGLWACELCFAAAKENQ